ncbi:pyrroline-5-carboxylate reductase [Gilvimarinus sp. F26214L]|uniref:pyrroline-5-carboxylate reductase n=1 Tax=Gilvimarinus sp. DZF01 TaxID=3461371 RepID=UPI004045F1D6
MSERITFIGGGNMANSIIGGLVARGFAPNQITACDPLQENLEKLKQSYGIATSTDNIAGVAEADTIVLAVKPQIMQAVCGQLRAGLSHRPLIISIAAGIPVRKLSDWLGDELAIVRCMPNTPALVQAGASGLFANDVCTGEQKASAENILAAVGIVEWLKDESMIDAVTAVSGSGPAYFFLFMEAMIDAAVDQGLSRESASHLAIQTCLGAGMLARDSDVDVAELRRRVCSPGGTTLKAIESFEQNNLRSIVAEAMRACADRAQEMADELN